VSGRSPQQFTKKAVHTERPNLRTTEPPLGTTGRPIARLCYFAIPELRVHKSQGTKSLADDNLSPMRIYCLRTDITGLHPHQANIS
jgi:hypothetical protein